MKFLSFALLLNMAYGNTDYKQVVFDAKLNAINFGDLEAIANEQEYQTHQIAYSDMEHAILPRYANRKDTLLIKQQDIALFHSASQNDSRVIEQQDTVLSSSTSKNDSRVMKLKNIDLTHEANQKDSNNSVSLLKPEDKVHAVGKLVKIQLLQQSVMEKNTIDKDRKMLDESVGDFCSENATLEEFEKIMVYVYVDVCTNEMENLTLWRWSREMKGFLKDRYEMEGQVKVIYPENCEKDGNAYDDLETEFRTNPNDINIAINVFRGGAAYGMHRNEVKEMEERHGIYNCFEFYVCSERENCVPETLVHHVYIRDVEHVVEYSRIYLVRQFMCHSVENAVPIEYRQGDEMKCACRCPPGHEKNDLNQCVAIESNCKCKWLQACYRYKVTSDWRSKNCTIKNWYGDAALVPIPFPHDNYVAFKENQGDETNTFQGPHIELQVNQTIQKYTWRYYQQNREAIFNGIRIKAAGKYILTLRAFDYGIVPETCTTTLIVEDANPPVSTEPCPQHKNFGDDGSSNVAVFNVTNYNRAVDAAEEFKSWVYGRVNDNCGNAPDDLTCDIGQYEQWDFHNELPIQRDTCLVHPHTCYQILQNDMMWMMQYIARIGDNSKLPGEKKYCKKCCELQHRFGENFVPYYCGSGNGPTQCQLGTMCSLKQCLITDGTEFFTTSLAINDGLRESTGEIIQQFPENGYNNVNEIHFAMDSICTSDYDNANCQIRQPVKTMYDVDKQFRSSGVHTDIFGGIGRPRNMIRWRYKMEGDGDWDWRVYKSSKDAIFNQFKTTILFEGWTACGRIAQQTMFVYLHLHTTLSVQDYFIDQSLYQSSRYKTSRADDSMCNFPDTDFAELTFEFDTIKAFQQNSESTTFSYTFSKISCMASIQNSSPVNILANYTSSGTILERFAIDLLNPTQPETEFIFSCNVYYQDYHKNDYSTPLTKTLKFIDCDEPGMDCPWAECQETCSSNTQRPNTVCGGNRISFDESTDSTTFTTLQRPCCKDCSSKINCVSIFPGIQNTTIDYCKFVEESTIQVLAIDPPSNFSTFIVLALFTTIILVLVFKHRPPSNLISGDLHEPLLAQC